MEKKQDNIVVLPEFVADNLGAPFKVILKNSVKQLIDPKTGKVKKTIIPNPRDLITKVALQRLTYSRKLSGSDIRFIRKALKIRAKELAEMIEISVEHMSRCESGERILSPGVEKCLRLAILLREFDIGEVVDEDCKNNDRLRKALDSYRSEMNKLKNLFRDFDISSVHDPDSELVMNFTVRYVDQSIDPLDETEGEWDEAPQAKAA